MKLAKNSQEKKKLRETNNPTSASGFTLVEMVVVMAVMALISGIVLSYNRTNEKRLLLFSNQAEIIGVLQRAKSFALEKRITGTDKPVCAFGVNFEKPRMMIIFQDLPDGGGDKCVSDGSDNFNKQYDENNGEEVETVNLNEGVEFESFSLSESSSSTVVFEPPYLETTGYGQIKLKVVGGSEAACVDVGVGAQIYGNSSCN